MDPSASRPAHPRPGKPRIDPVAEPDAEVREIITSVLASDGRPLNVLATVGRHPKLLKRFNLLGGFLLNKGSIPPREREVVILRVGANAHSEYEFGQHTVIGRACGLTEVEIAALVHDPDAHQWSDADRDLIAMVDELHGDDCVSDATWSNLAARWTDEQLVELLVLAGFYRLVSGFLNSAGVQLDDGVPGFPPGT